MALMPLTVSKMLDMQIFQLRNYTYLRILFISTMYNSLVLNFLQKKDFNETGGVLGGF